MIDTEQERMVLPSVFKPGTQATPDGYREVSTHTFAESVIQHLGDDRLVFRLGDVLGVLEGDQGHRRFRPLDVDAARLVVDQAVRITSCKKDEEGVLRDAFHPCTRDLAGIFLAHARSTPQIRTLRSLVSYPVYLPGFDLAQPGWNAKGGVFYDAPAHLTEVTPSDGGSTLALADLFADFPIKDEASLCNLYALMLTRVLRPAIEGPTPFFFVMASLERTGKGKCLDVSSLAVTGERMPPMQVGGEEDEREKRITSLILKGAQAVHFDNVPTGVDLDSAAIASLATAWPSWSGRVLGASSMPTLPNSMVVAFSGNNPRASGENAKRSVPIVLESRTDAPELRDDFQHPDCYAYALEQRPAVLSCLLGLVERWKAEKRPRSKHRMGGFERWAAAVGGILHLAGCGAFLGNYTAWVKATNDFGADAEAFVAEWERLHPGETISAKQGMAMADEVGIFGGYFGGKNEIGRATSFSRKVLGALVDRPVGSHKISRIGSGSSSLYVLNGNGATETLGLRP